MKNKFVVIAIIVIIAVIAGWSIFSNSDTTDQSPKTITVFWAEWAPAESLKELVKIFKAETGIEVIVKTSPWETFQTDAFKVFESRGQDFDMVVGDSQWLGVGSREGYYVELTDFIEENKLKESMHPIAVEGYGAYPKESGRYWAIPFEGDALGWAYRKDLFEDPEERAAFRAKYNYELSVPETWDEVKNIAEFFYRPEDGLYGIGLPTGTAHDPLTMGVQNMIWAWGGDLGNYKTHKVKGILDSRASTAGLEFYKELYQFTPPGYENTFYTDPQDDFKEGKLAMYFSYFAFFPDLEDPKSNPYQAVTGYFKMPMGPMAQVASLGGQGLSINSYSSKKEAAFAFAEWFIKDEVQHEWARLGGFSVSKEVLASEAFLKNGARFNPVFAESMNMLKDFWADPVYPELLAASQKKWSQYITTDTITAEQTMKELAQEWENTFEDNGYYRE